MNLYPVQSEQELKTMCETKPIENLRLILQFMIMQRDQGLC